MPKTKCYSLLKDICTQLGIDWAKYDNFSTKLGKYDDTKYHSNLKRWFQNIQNYQIDYNRNKGFIIGIPIDVKRLIVEWYLENSFVEPHWLNKDNYRSIKKSKIVDPIMIQLCEDNCQKPSHKPIYSTQTRLLSHSKREALNFLKKEFEISKHHLLLLKPWFIKYATITWHHQCLCSKVLNFLLKFDIQNFHSVC